MPQYRLYNNAKDCYVGEEREFENDREAIAVYELAVQEQYNHRADLQVIKDHVSVLKLLRIEQDGTKLIIAWFDMPTNMASVIAVVTWAAQGDWDKKIIGENHAYKRFTEQEDVSPTPVEKKPDDIPPTLLGRLRKLLTFRAGRDI